MWICVFPAACVYECPLGPVSLSIRVKGLEMNRWFSGVHNDPLSLNAKCFPESLHKLSVNMVSVGVCACITNMHFGQKWQLCLPSCMRVVVSFKKKKNVRGSGCRHVCKSVCRGIGIPSPWAIRGQTDPIMFVLGDQIGFIPSRPAACWCSFQPAWMDYSFHFMLWTWVCGSLCLEVCLYAAPQHCLSIGCTHASVVQGQLASLTWEHDLIHYVSYN